MEELRKQTVARIAEFFNGESNNAKVDTYKKLLDFEKEVIKAINYTRCSTPLKLVYTNDFCKWLKTGFTYYDKTNDFVNKKGYRMTFKELVNKYEKEQNKKALIV